MADEQHPVIGKLSDEGLLSFLDVESVVTLPRDTSKDQLLRFMVETLVTMGRLPAALLPSITAGLLRREQLGTTGLGNGLALPHLLAAELTEFVGLVGLCTDGVDFESLDGNPTRIVILVLSPVELKQRHFDVLSRLARLFCEGTLQYATQLTRSPEALLRLLGVSNQRIG